MPVNPYDQDEAQRQAQITALRQPQAYGAPGNALSEPGQRPAAAVVPGPQIFEGFDFGREQNTGKSAKDSFAHYAKLAPTAPTHDKKALEAWAKQYVMPGMNADGHGVSSIDGDKLRFKNWQGEFDVDYGRGAGAEGGALAWQADDVNAILGAQAPGGSVASPAMGGGMNLMDNSSLGRIMAELNATANNEQSPAEREAVLQMLQAI